MWITHALRGEHGVFYALFDRIETRAAEAGASGLQGMVLLLDAALRSHASAEDELLFTALERHLDPTAGPLAVMRSEHREIEGTLDRLLEDGGDLEARSAALLRLVGIARSHFAKEEHVLFPLAEKALDPETLERAANAWAERRGVVLL